MTQKNLKLQFEQRSLADRTQKNGEMQRKQFVDILHKRLDGEINPVFENCIYELYRAFKKAKDEDRDTIWEFIVRESL